MIRSPLHRCLFSTCVVALLASSISLVQIAVAEELTGKKWIDMDYGPYMTHSFQASRPKGNIAYKGLKIKLGDRGRVFLFDTDLLRVAAGWTEAKLDWRNVIYDGSHGTHPNIKGEPVFANPKQPGWAKDGKFDDPRKLPYGPMPKDWAKWKGLYLHGEDVILSYQVGDADILERPGMFEDGETTLLTRELNVGKSSTNLLLQVAYAEEAEAAGISLTSVVGKSFPPKSAHAVLRAQDNERTILTAVTCLVDSPDVEFDITDPNNIRLKIPSKATPLDLKLVIGQGDEDIIVELEETWEAVKPAIDLTTLTKGGPARYSETITTNAKLGTKQGAFLTDEVTLPRKNPWRSWMRIGGFDFLTANRAAVCTWSGDVWLVDGLEGNLGELTWKRIAVGMFQPLGLKVLNGKIYVCCRDQITRLHDLNGDDEIDFYENFNNDHQVTEHFHEFAMDLQADAQGNFYYAKSARHAKTPLVPHHGTLIKVAADGSSSEIVCNGFRAANGVGVGPNGELAVSDQEGHWTPANRINLVRSGGFYGNMWSFHQGNEPETYDPPLVWLPKKVDRSPAAQLWVPEGAWGPLGGKLIHTSYGTGQLWHVLQDHNAEVPQGGVVRLPLRFPTGVMRGRFSPHDGNLYVCGLVGWSSSTPIDGGFYRIRYTEEPLRLPVGLKVVEDGIELTFSDELDADAAEDYQNWGVAQWNYRWSRNYGSPHFSVKNERRQGEDEVEVLEATLSDDGRTVSLELEDFQEVMSMRVEYTIETADGEKLKDTLWLTINDVP